MENSDLGVVLSFLLPLQDNGYAWRQNGSAVEFRSLDPAFSTSPVIAHYFGVRATSTRLRGS